jgi:hypothetical protein
MEVAGDPLRVVYRRIQLVAHVDDATGTAETEHDEGEGQGQHLGAVPGQGLEPPKCAFASAQPGRDFHGGANGKDSQERGHRHERGEHRMHELEARTHLRVHEQVRCLVFQFQ